MQLDRQQENSPKLRKNRQECFRAPTRTEKTAVALSRNAGEGGCWEGKRARTDVVANLIYSLSFRGTKKNHTFISYRLCSDWCRGFVWEAPTWKETWLSRAVEWQSMEERRRRSSTFSRMRRSREKADSRWSRLPGEIPEKYWLNLCIELIDWLIDRLHLQYVFDLFLWQLCIKRVMDETVWMNFQTRQKPSLANGNTLR